MAVTAVAGRLWLTSEIRAVCSLLTVRLAYWERIVQCLLKSCTGDAASLDRRTAVDGLLGYRRLLMTQGVKFGFSGRFESLFKCTSLPQCNSFLFGRILSLFFCLHLLLIELSHQAFIQSILKVWPNHG